ncbi:diaminopimelate epimerase [Patescibacteria group bacterium]|nr:diaminopimelate epimerase [Patescibacteria group bacterium]
MEFYKYHGAGNDFIMIDNRNSAFDIEDKEKIKLMCHRRFGIAADGILTVEEDPNYDFKMQYVNSDGSIGAMCGNGGRCIVHFANSLGLIKNTRKIKFLAVDGEHEAEILDNGLIKLKMQDVKDIGERNGLPFLHSGTAPHNIMYVEDLENFPVFTEGRRIRNLDREGVNVNFVEINENTLNMRTYERGVEDETWACGTGATSAAIASHHLGKISGNSVAIKMQGGDLKIDFEREPNGTYKNIWLTGPAVCVFKGNLN